MKYSNPKNLAILASLLLGGLMTLVYIATTVPMEIFHWEVILSSLPVIVLGGYFIFYYVLERFIYEKIKLIYKTILRQKATSEEKKRKMRSDSNSDVIEQVNQQVIDWASERREEIQRLKQLADYRREYVGNVSHELKTPIFNIQGYVLTLLDGGLEDPNINKKYLLRTEKSINRMITIVEDLEAIAKLEAGELEMNREVFDLLELTNEVLEMMEEKAMKKQVNIYYAEDYEIPVFVNADRERIRQVLTNLIDNSMKYNGKPKSAERKTKISFFDMDEHILVEVTDNGQGIDEEDLPRLFERFYRTKAAREQGKKGSGLGLSIVKHIIEAHNETINVRSKPGVGTTFAFTLKKAASK
jgi:two-component system phosphate regulon sensor histidine kinase PhoR